MSHTHITYQKKTKQKKTTEQQVKKKGANRVKFVEESGYIEEVYVNYFFVGRYVFWADQGTGKIERAGLDGNDRRTLIEKDIYWPNQLAVSYPTRYFLKILVTVPIS